MREALQDVVGHAGVDERRLTRSMRSFGAVPMPLTISPSSRMPRIDMRGLSEAKGSWKTICMRERNGRSAWRSRPSMRLAVEDDLAAVLAGSAGSAPGRRWSCPSPTRRRCPSVSGGGGEVEIVDGDQGEVDPA